MRTPRFPKFLITAAIAAVTLLPVAAPAQNAQPSRAPDVIFVPTPQEVVDAMLEVAKVGPDDVLYDLGSGNGIIPVTAARDRGARGVGIDIDPERIREANENARAAGVADRVRFIQQDMFEADLREATVVTLYLVPQFNQRLRPKLLRELPPGARIVSHQYDMGDDWPPLRKRRVGLRTIYLWVIPGRNGENGE